MVHCFSLTTKQHQPAYQPQKPSAEQLDKLNVLVQGLHIWTSHQTNQIPKKKLTSKCINDILATTHCDGVENND